MVIFIYVFIKIVQQMYSSAVRGCNQFGVTNGFSRISLMLPSTFVFGPVATHGHFASTIK